MNFRHDIQILRGVAVLFVVLFHLGVSSIKSGFLGVDVFFVISGFLMAVLYSDTDIKGFYLRRAKRLLPSYYVIIFCTLVVSFIINTPNETNQVLNQVLYGSGFLSNIGFWLQNSYFSKAEFNPLLHLWSLGVEIQFYIFVPLLAYFFKKSSLNFFLIALSSLMLCFLILPISPKTSFFMMPLRVWQFLLGYGAALYFTNNGNVKYINLNWLGCIGLFLILLIPFFQVDGQSLNIYAGHPGLVSFLVCIATCLVLIFGVPQTIENNKISMMLVFLGKYSYSIYLVHFPVIVLYLSEPFGGTILEIPSLIDGFVIISLIVSFSYLLYHFVETQTFKLGVVKSSIGFTAAILAMILFLPLLKSYFTSSQESKIFNAFTDRSPYRCGKLVRVLDPSAISCKLSTSLQDVDYSVLLVGNSHADSIKTAFSKVAEKNNISTYFLVQNNPLMPGGMDSGRIIAEATLKGVKHIVVHFSPNAISSEALTQLVSLAQNNNISVTFIEPVPVWSKHIPMEMFSELNGKDSDLHQTKDDYLSANKSFLNNLYKLDSPNFNIVHVVDYFCKPDCVYKSDNGTPLYFDSGHLTLTGSKLLESAFKKALFIN